MVSHLETPKPLASTLFLPTRRKGKRFPVALSWIAPKSQTFGHGLRAFIPGIRLPELGFAAWQRRHSCPAQLNLVPRLPPRYPPLRCYPLHFQKLETELAAKASPNPHPPHHCPSARRIYSSSAVVKKSTYL